MAEIYSMISMIAFGCAAICFIVLIFMWIRFDIKGIYGNISGKSMQKSIAQMHEEHEMASKRTAQKLEKKKVEKPKREKKSEQKQESSYVEEVVSSTQNATVELVQPATFIVTREEVVIHTEETIE